MRSCKLNLIHALHAPERVRLVATWPDGRELLVAEGMAAIAIWLGDDGFAANLPRYTDERIEELAMEQSL